MAKQQQPKKSGGKGLSAGLVILFCFFLAIGIYMFVFGNSSNFVGENTANHPVNLLGTIHKGGYIVPILLTMLLTVLVLSVERFIAIRKARGTGDLTKFVANIKDRLEADEIAGAKEL